MDQLPLAVDIESDRMRGALVRDSDLDSERTVVLNELDAGENEEEPAEGEEVEEVDEEEDEEERRRYEAPGRQTVPVVIRIAAHGDLTDLHRERDELDAVDVALVDVEQQLRVRCDGCGQCRPGFSQRMFRAL